MLTKMDSNRNMSQNLDNSSILSIVISLFDEEMNEDILIESLTRVLTALKDPYEVVLVDVGSKDGTWANQ